MGRQNRNQFAHDHRIRTIANKLRNEGWKVQADLPNFNQPDPIGKDARIPDILATRGNETKIIEVKTSPLLISIKSSTPRLDVVLPSEKRKI